MTTLAMFIVSCAKKGGLFRWSENGGKLGYLHLFLNAVDLETRPGLEPSIDR